mgnify:CR=1 FL=1|jgi:hypothetical protein
MAINLEGEGKPIARIMSEKDKSKKMSKILHVADEEDNVINPYKYLQCKKNECIQQIPNYDTERDTLYICGKSGSGKTLYMKKYIAQYNILYPTRQIYIFAPLSDVSNDPSLEGLKNVNLIDINSDEFLDAELSSKDFQDSLVAFDDCDNIKDKLLSQKLDKLLTNLLQCGRHTNTTVIYLSHIACNGHSTKAILNECHTITFFPKGLGGKTLKYLLENYLSLDKNQIEQIKKIKSRHITVFNTYPTAVLFDKGLYVLH